VLITHLCAGELTLNCGAVRSRSLRLRYIETGNWLERRARLRHTNAQRPAHHNPPWVTHELKKKAVDQACVEPQLKKRGHAGTAAGHRGSLRQASGALANAKLETQSQITVMLSNGVKLNAEVQKFSPPAVGRQHRQGDAGFDATSRCSGCGRYLSCVGHTSSRSRSGPQSWASGFLSPTSS